MSNLFKNGHVHETQERICQSKTQTYSQVLQAYTFLKEVLNT